MALALLRNNQPTNAQNQQPTAPIAPVTTPLLSQHPPVGPSEARSRELFQQFSMEPVV